MPSLKNKLFHVFLRHLFTCTYVDYRYLWQKKRNYTWKGNNTSPTSLFAQKKNHLHIQGKWLPTPTKLHIKEKQLGPYLIEIGDAVSGTAETHGERAVWVHRGAAADRSGHHVSPRDLCGEGRHRLGGGHLTRVVEEKVDLALLVLSHMELGRVF